MKTDNNPIFLQTKMGEGHGGPTGRYDFLKDIAFQYSFVLAICDIEE